MIGEIKNVKLDQDESNEWTIFIDFTMNDAPFFIVLKKNGTRWEPNNVIHSAKGDVVCEFCKEKVEKLTTCLELTKVEENLNEIFLSLLNMPTIRLRMLMEGVRA